MIGWEIILIAVIVIAAIAYIVWYLFRPVRKKSDCCGCSYADSCKANCEKSR